VDGRRVSGGWRARERSDSSVWWSGCAGVEAGSVRSEGRSVDGRRVSVVIAVCGGRGVLV
jgi:hypothetical protein